MPSQESVSCTDEEMQEILESVIFVDAVKFPPFVSQSCRCCFNTLVASMQDGGSAGSGISLWWLKPDASDSG